MSGTSRLHSTASPRRSILTYERNQPEAAVPHAHRALLADPLDGNSWQDLVVIYGRTLGVSFD